MLRENEQEQDQFMFETEVEKLEEMAKKNEQ